MNKNHVLLISDDARTEAAVKEALAGQAIETAKTAAAALAAVKAAVPGLALLDLELKGADGLQLFKQLLQAAPRLNAVILSAENDIPLAVAATKLGAADFLRKPVVAKLLRDSVAQNLAPAAAAQLPPAAAQWLHGGSAALKKFYLETGNFLAGSNKNLLLLGGPGIAKRDVAAYLHASGPKKKRGLRAIDLADFRRADLEAPLWSSLQEIMTARETQSEEDRCGTLYLDKIETLEPSLRAGIFQFVRDRKGKLDGEIVVAIGLGDRALAGEADGFAQLEIPALKERGEDLPLLINFYLKRAVKKYDKPAKGVAADALDLLALYDYPGNYRELAGLIEQAVLAASGELVELKDLPLDLAALKTVSIRRSLLNGQRELKAARREFEKELYDVLLKKSGGGVAAVARFLDVPKTALSERLDELGGDPAD